METLREIRDKQNEIECSEDGAICNQFDLIIDDLESLRDKFNHEEGEKIKYFEKGKLYYCPICLNKTLILKNELYTILDCSHCEKSLDRGEYRMYVEKFMDIETTNKLFEIQFDYLQNYGKNKQRKG